MRKKFWTSLLVFATVSGMVVPTFAAERENDGEQLGGVFAAAQEMSALAEKNDAEFDGYIVRLKSDVVLSHDAENMEGVEKLSYTPGTYTVDTLELAEAFADEDYIEYIEPNYLVYLYDSDLKSATVPNDKYYDTYQWNMTQLNVQAAWNYGIEGQDLDDKTDINYDGVNDNDPIVIAVIDSGLKQGHEDIDWDRVLDGQDFSGNGSTNDQQGHGTFVTGLIMATKDNELGIAGIAQNVYVMPLRVFGTGDSTSTSTIVSAINYAAQQRETFDATKGAEGTNISVINMSLGGESADSTMKEAVDRAIAAGIIVICAAGNDGDATASYPAQYAIGIGSTNSSNSVSYYSQRLSAANGSGYANKVWVSAPGEDVVSLYYESTSSYTKASGTSFSSPEVAALAALCKGLDNTLNHESFKQLLKDTATPRDSGLGTVNGQDIGYGWGTVDFGSTINALIGDMEGTASVRVEVKNEAGSDISGAKYAVYELNDDETRGKLVAPDSEGVYTLQRGQRYEYEASAPKYDTQSGVFAVLTENRTFTITLLGQTYYTRFVGWNTADKVIPGLEISVSTANGKKITQNADGSFGTRNGEYRYTVQAEGYFPTSGTFTINDLEDGTLEQGKLINVLLYGDIDVCSMDFEVIGAAGESITSSTGIKLTNSAGEVMERYTDGLYKLHPDTYSYTATNAEYQTVTGGFVIREQDKGSESMRRVYLMDKLYYVYFDVMPLTAKAEVTVWNGLGEEETVVTSSGTPTYKLINGTYKYQVVSGSKTQYNTMTGTFTVSGKKLFVELSMSKGTGKIDDGTSADRFITVNSSLYALSKLQEHTTEKSYQRGDARTTAEGILLRDVLTYFTANVRSATSVTVSAADGESVQIPASDFENVMIAWKVGGSEAMSLAVDGRAVWLENVVRVSANYHEHTETVTVLKEATCTQPGSARYICIDCGQERTQELPALGHDFDEHGVCRRCGKTDELSSVTVTIDGTEVSTAEFYGYATAATYTMVSYYSNESHTVVGITLKDLVENFLPDKCVTSIAVTSGYDGYTQNYSKAAFGDAMIAWLVDGLPASSYDSDNGLRMAVNNGSSGMWIYSPAQFDATGGEHSYDDGVVTAPTCGAQGYTTRTCTGCGSRKVSDYTPATGAHTWDDGLVAREPGCETAGTKVFYCTTCGEMKSEEISPLGHSYENSVCTRCGEKEPEPDITVDNRTNGLASVAVGERDTSGMSTAVVASGSACVVLFSTDGGKTYAALQAHPAGTASSYSFRFDSSGSVKLLVALKGDADLSGTVDSRDVALAKQFASRLATATPQQKLLLGVDARKQVTGITVLRLQRAVAGLYTLTW